ncbi:MAG: dTDP-4-dehydrorhamnose 3,5-epimerase [Roseobacter sp.]|nr:dTDP-4-dehydrorhamnose 3,5-epimerase [Roseobacter sp.]
MEIEHTALGGVVLLTPRRFGDHRGFFSESWNRRSMAKAGLDIDWVQDNHSVSAAKGTVRGLHFQAPPHAQAKLVRCGRGALYDVAVDIRRGSPTYGRWVGVELSAENGRQLLVPAGFLHGFVTRQPDTEIIYKCSDYYSADADGAVHWDSCGIDWGLGDSLPILSEKDSEAPPLSAFSSPFVWEEESAA